MGAFAVASTVTALEAWENAETAALVPACSPIPAPLAAFKALEPTLTRYGSSRFGEYRRCQRAHALRWRDQIVPLRLGPPSSADYFGLGILIHAATAYVWEGLKLGEERDWLDVMVAATQREGSVRRDTWEEAQRLLSAYYAFHGLPDWDLEHVKILDVERELCETAAWQLPYTARLDLVISVDGILHVVDTKSRAKDLPSDRVSYARKLRTRPQFIGQAWLAKRFYGLDYVPPVIVNAIVKTKIPKFARLAVPLQQQDLDCWEEQQGKDALAGLSGDAMNYSSCAPEMGSPCAYLEYCHGSDEQRTRLFGVADLAQAAADAHSIDVAA